MARRKEIKMDHPMVGKLVGYRAYQTENRLATRWAMVAESCLVGPDHLLTTVDWNSGELAVVRPEQVTCCMPPMYYLGVTPPWVVSGLQGGKLRGSTQEKTDEAL